MASPSHLILLPSVSSGKGVMKEPPHRLGVTLTGGGGRGMISRPETWYLPAKHGSHFQQITAEESQSQEGGRNMQMAHSGAKH